MPRIIEVIVSPSGGTTIQTQGFVGTECLEVGKFLEHALGVVADDRKTAEFYQSARTEAHVEQ